MPRFRVNRWLTKLLALQLALVLAVSAIAGSVMRAEAGSAFDSEPGGDPLDPGLGGSGDPDIPFGNAKYRPGTDRYPAVTEGNAAVVAADSGSAWIVRLRFAALGLKAYWLRF